MRKIFILLILLTAAMVYADDNFFAETKVSKVYTGKIILPDNYKVEDNIIYDSLNKALIFH